MIASKDNGLEKLYKLVKQACIDYKYVYGKYPSKIGIHYHRISEFCSAYGNCIYFPTDIQDREVRIHQVTKEFQE